MAPRIVIDCRFAATHSGLGRYTRELTRHLVQRKGAEYVLLVGSKKEGWLYDLQVEVLEAAIPHYSVAEQTRLPSLIKRSGAQLLLSPHFNVPLRCPIPFVVTIHDLILHAYPNNASFVRQRAYRFLMTNAVKKAEAIVAVSSFVAGEVRKEFGDRTAAKLRTIEEGVTENFSPRSAEEQKVVLRKYGIERPFFLYVGNAKQHKNVPLLLRAFSCVSGDARLVLVTGGPEAMSLVLPPKTLLIPSVTEDDLPALYSAATACVTASLYEGFCLPLVEALSCGCPVIAARRGAIPNIIAEDEHALLLETTEEAFLQAFRHPPISRAPLRRWSWEDAAEKTERLLLACLSSIP